MMQEELASSQDAAGVPARSDVAGADRPSEAPVLADPGTGTPPPEGGRLRVARRGRDEAARAEGQGAPVRLGTSLKKEILRTTRQAHARIQMALGASTPLPEIVRRLPVAPWNEARRAALVAELLDLGRQIEACERRVAAAVAELDALPVENRMIRV